MSSFASSSAASVEANPQKKRELISVGGGKRVPLSEIVKVAALSTGTGTGGGSGVFVEVDAPTAIRMTDSMAAEL